jgi:hypothetical protein
MAMGWLKGDDCVKNGKRLSRHQKLVLFCHGLNPSEWLISKKLPHVWVLVHRKRNQVTTLRFDDDPSAG